MDHNEIAEKLMALPDEVLDQISFTMPWQSNTTSSDVVDEDGFPVSSINKEDSNWSQQDLQKECWRKFQNSPHVNTSVRGLAGRHAGFGFEVTSGVHTIQTTLDEIHYDWRNRLYTLWPKYVARSIIEGELFLMFTVHEDGFVEIDFVDPGTLTGGDDDTGVFFHPQKTVMPVMYNIGDGANAIQVPSIYVAQFPEMLKSVKTDPELQKSSKSRSPKFKKFGGFYRFICNWDKGFLTRRAVGYLRTTLQWLNHYENLKKYEIDHKKSAASYLWVFSMEDRAAFSQWLALSDEDRAKTGILAKKTPGSSLVLPPGVKLTAQFPQLSKISDEDTDILHMITSGLNEPEDITTGSAKSSLGGVKASRGPMSDRVSDELHYFKNFLLYDFYKAIFILKNGVTPRKFPKTFKVKEAVAFDENQKPIFKEVKKAPEHLVDVNFPTSDTVDYEARAKGLLGTKHGPISEQVGVPKSKVAEKMGFSGYPRLRLQKATEDELYPDLVYENGVDAESQQEKAEGEPGKSSNNKQED